LKLRVRDICEIGDRLFSQRLSLSGFWQEVAENFYPERADFTVRRALGTEFASGIMTGAPVLTRRELADQIAAMIRPRGKKWFGLAPQDEAIGEKQAVKDWIDQKCTVMSRAMDDPDARFKRAAKETDNDYVTFGQGVMTIELDEVNNSLLYRNWHLRDVAWSENDRLVIDTIHRNWKIQCRDMIKRYPKSVDQKVITACKTEPFKEIDCRHVIIPYDEYDYTPPNGKKPREGQWKYMSILVDRENEKILSETPIKDHPYIIPRWQTVSGSQYGHSPATVIALPDARLLQRITFTLIEAGEKATNPPMLAVQEALRSDISLLAGGVTWVDAAYDERLGEVLRPISQDKSGLNFGADLAGRHEEMIRAAFYLNKIMLPAYDGAAMTATEVRTRTEEYIRSALPLFEPIEAEYSGQLCEKTFNILMDNGAFGPAQNVPDELRGADLKWVFKSPLTDAVDREDALSFQETAQLLSMAVQIDPSLKADYDVRKHFRKAMKGLGAPMIDEEQADEAIAQAQQMAQLQQTAGMVGQGAGVAEQVGKAIQSLTPQQAEAA